MFRQGFQFPFLILVTGNIRESKLVPPFDQLRPGRCKLPYCGNGGITSPYHNSVCHIGHPFHGRQIVGRGIENIDEVTEGRLDFDKGCNDHEGKAVIGLRQLHYVYVSCQQPFRKAEGRQTVNVPCGYVQKGS